MIQELAGLVNTECTEYAGCMPNLNILIGDDLLKRIDDFRFKHRFQSRTEAIRWLIEAALKAKLAPKDASAS
jgi:metal-responsive CopG/Arc/MetJ family transcriptional regulator